MSLASISKHLIIAGIIIALSVFSLYKLRTAFYSFDTVQIDMSEAKDDQGSGAQLDAILTQHLYVFGHIRSFDPIFKKSAYSIQMPPLWVDRCEVRQKDFYTFEKWYTRHRPTDIAHPEQPQGWAYRSASRDHKISGRLDAPANGVSYYDAYAYCQASGGRLPTRSEWIAIASGSEGRLYPWGNSFNSEGWPYLDPRLNAAQRCGLHKEMDSPQGIHNLGNVASEWAQGISADEKPSIHGGNAYNKPYQIYSLNNFYRTVKASYRSPYVSFRCVYDGQPKPIPWTEAKPETVRMDAGSYRIGIPDDAKIPGLLGSGLSRKQLGIVEKLIDKKHHHSDFQILRHEVTRAQYRRFINDPLVQYGLYANEKEPEGHDYTPSWLSDYQNDDLPATDIDWWSAYAFANWAGGRLPNSFEWITASSMGSYSYPWGNSFNPEYTATAEQQLIRPRSALEENGDITAAGVINMGGNVSEWTQSLSTAGQGFAMIAKGGNYILPGVKTARIDFENPLPASFKAPYLGFRVVFDG